MRKLLTLIVVAIGVAALVRKLRRRYESGVEIPPGAPDTPAPPPAPPTGEDPAEALRRKLASTRDETATDSGEPEEPGESIEKRRASVHEQGRAAIDEMQQTTEE